MEENTYKVLVRCDEYGRIIEVNSSGFVDDLDGWTVIDEGTRDRFYLAQNNYFEKPIFDNNGVEQYKLENGVAVERNPAEILADYEQILSEREMEQAEIITQEDILLALMDIAQNQADLENAIVEIAEILGGE